MKEKPVKQKGLCDMILVGLPILQEHTWLAYFCLFINVLGKVSILKGSILETKVLNRLLLGEHYPAKGYFRLPTDKNFNSVPLAFV